VNTDTFTSPRPDTVLSRHNVIAIGSGKGGVGKTWLSVTLAHALSRIGDKILLFDGDLGLANLDIQLGLMPKHDLASVIAGRLGLAQAITYFDQGDFDIIAGRSGSGGLANLATSRLQALVNELAQVGARYNHVIIDLGAGVEATVRRLAGVAGTVIVVVTDEPTSLTDGYAFIKLSHADWPERQIKIICNMVNSTREGERTYNTLRRACEGFLDISPPLLGIIRRDDRVRETIRSQLIILNEHPTSEAAQDVTRIARAMTS
jgi:flagellar biosynthesis protein FlhG